MFLPRRQELMKTYSFWITVAVTFYAAKKKKYLQQVATPVKSAFNLKVVCLLTSMQHMAFCPIIFRSDNSLPLILLLCRALQIYSLFVLWKAFSKSMKGGETMT